MTKRKMVALLTLLLLSGCGNQELAKNVADVYGKCKGIKTVEVYVGTFLEKYDRALRGKAMKPRTMESKP